MLSSSPEPALNKRYLKLRRKKRRKRIEFNQRSLTDENRDLLLHHKRKKPNYKSSKNVQPDKEQKLSDHESLLRQHFGPKVTSKTRLTKPAQVTGMFAQGMHSTYIARDTMNEVTRAYLKEDLHHIIEMANTHKAPVAKTARKQPVASQLVEAPLDRSVDVDDPSPVPSVAGRWDASPEASVATHNPKRAPHSSPEFRFLPQQKSTPRGPRQPRAGALNHRRGGGRPGLRERHGPCTTTVVPESSSDSSSEAGVMRDASHSPTCSFEQFLSACSDGAVASVNALAALDKRIDWPSATLSKLQELYIDRHSLHQDQAGQLANLSSKVEPEKGSRAEDNSQRSSSQLSTGVQTSPGLFSQSAPPGRAGSTDSDVHSPDLGVSPATIVMDPRKVLEMLSDRQLPVAVESPGTSCSSYSGSTSDSSRKRRCSLRQSLSHPSPVDSARSECDVGEENVKSTSYQVVSSSDEESPLVTYYCFRRH